MKKFLSIKSKKDCGLDKSNNSFNGVLNKEKCDDVKNFKENTTYSINKIVENYKVTNLDEVNARIVEEANRNRKLEEIIQIIEKDSNLLEKLDVPKLEIIDKYYKDKIIRYKKKLGILS